MDGRLDLNFSVVFPSLAPGSYSVVWRIMLQPGYVRGYGNFRAQFSLPAKAKKARAGSSAHVRASELRHARGPIAPRPMQQRTLHGPHAPQSLQRHAGEAERRRHGWRALVPALDCAHVDDLSGHGGHAAAAALAAAQPVPLGANAIPPAPPASGAAGQPPVQATDAQQPGHAAAVQPPAQSAPREIQPEPHAEVVIAPPPAAQPADAQAELARAMSDLARASMKRAPARAERGPRFVPGCLSLLWGGYASAWKQFDPAGPMGRGWCSLHMGTLTVRRTVDVHLHNVVVQLRPVHPQPPPPPGADGRAPAWPGALLDYVELVPSGRGRGREGGLLPGLLPAFLAGRHATPADLVVVPTL